MGKHSGLSPVCAQLVILLGVWNEQSDAGYVMQEPGIIFTDDTNVIPDVIWISNERFQAIVHKDGKLHHAPELVVEVLSPGAENERRDREVKLKLYSRHGVKEYWVVNWQAQSLEVYRRVDDLLMLEKTLDGNSSLESPLLPGFSCKVSRIFKKL